MCKRVWAGDRDEPGKPEDGRADQPMPEVGCRPFNQGTGSRRKWLPPFSCLTPSEQRVPWRRPGNLYSSRYGFSYASLVQPGHFPGLDPVGSAARHQHEMPNRGAGRGSVFAEYLSEPSGLGPRLPVGPRQVGRRKRSKRDVAPGQIFRDSDSVRRISG